MDRNTSLSKLIGDIELPNGRLGITIVADYIDEVRQSVVHLVVPRIMEEAQIRLSSTN